MPEGDTIFRAARTLDLALRGQRVTAFESVFPHLTRVDEDAPLGGRVVEGVVSAGKHLLMHFSGALTLRTHMRMSGSWHVYRPGERWWRSRSRMRIRVATTPFEAVAFDVHDAQFVQTPRLARDSAVGRLGPDLLGPGWNAADAVARMAATTQPTAGEMLLDQRVMAGIGNVFKSEVLFLCGIDPWLAASALTDDIRHELAACARDLLRANTGAGAARVARPSIRRTTGRANPEENLWVYGRAGAPCRRCGTPIASRKQGADSRTTYWCPRCQTSRGR